MSSRYEKRVIENNAPLTRNLGPDPLLDMRNKQDKVKFTNFVSSDKLPDWFDSMIYALTREDVVVNRKRFWKALNENTLGLLNAINGRGQDYAIKGTLAEQGQYVDVTPPPEKPGVLDRVMQTEKYREFEEYKERQNIGLE